MPKILIADDHAILRHGLREILERGIQNAECGEAKDGEEVLTLVKQGSWDIVLLDLSMPGRSGLDILDDLHQLRPTLPVLVLSMHCEDPFGKRALKSGASGYMSKECASHELIGAIRRILAGGRYVSTTLAEKLAADLDQNGWRPVHESLSPREFQILRLIASGLTAREIGEELRLAGTTVSTYRARILEKTKAKSTAELIRYAFTNHLAD
jgi:two-component system invasion response regulator UvrY